ncbi:orc1/cdc6 family replication initiation protein [Halocatena marina]|uniref:ORC1-type DNA replication protein n=1 Tax=Halocatena marina TaxID=2934937 RepID=A0ABD5YXX4_9EURY|nr:orc1/cdc6 family replication initiation protein [Halocatena marina]
MGMFERTASVFDDAMVLDEEYQPDKIRERDEELEQYRQALQPIIDNRPLSNIFVYGKTGTGKTVATRYMIDHLQEDAEHYDDVALSITWVGCENLSSSYQVAVALVNELRSSDHQISTTGHSQQAVFNMLYTELDKIGGTVLIVLDEIDNIGSDDDILYGLPRARANGYIEDARPLVIGISNDFQFKENLSPKVRDTLCEAEILFPPYDATELNSILYPRAEKAFYDDVLADDVVPLCSAFAAQDTGSARQALRLLYLAGKRVADNGETNVTGDHVRGAKEELHQSKVIEGMQKLTTQGHAVLLTLASHTANSETPVRTRDLYDRYKTVTEKIDADTIVERRVRAHLSDLTMLGLVTVHERNEGLNAGRYHEYELSVQLDSVLEVLSEEQRFDDIVEIVKQQVHGMDRT